MRSPVPILGLAALLGLSWPAPEAPHVAKVEPPSWWAGHSIDPVRLLLTGAHLDGARIESARPDIRPGAPRASADGRYVFVDVRVDARAAPGPAGLSVVTSAGRVPVPFDIAPPLPRAGRFQGLSPDDAIYLLMPDRFANGDPSNDAPPQAPGLVDRTRARYYHGGDLQGVIERLPYLQDLGVTTLWLNPVYDNANHVDPERRYDGLPFTDYHGYGAVDFYAVDEHLGDLAVFRRLVDEAHARGLKVMQDQVANHTGPLHPWAAAPPTLSWFNGTREHHLDNTFDIAVLRDPRASAPMRRAVLEGWFAGLLPDLNQLDAEVARYVIQNSLWWLGTTGLDAIRQDTVPYVPAAFWRDWTAAIRREYPSVTIVGEVLDPTPALVARWQRGHTGADGVDAGFDALFDYPLHFGIRRAVRGGSMRDITGVLHQDGEYPAADSLVTLIGSHDVPRFMGEPGATPGALKLAATLLFTMRGTPQWYYGDEIALAGGDDPDNRRDFPGGWPDDPRDAFTAAGRTPVEQDVFAHVRQLLHLRRERPALRRGALVHLWSSPAAYVYARRLPEDLAIVALNGGPDEARLPVPVHDLGLREDTVLRDRLGGSTVTVQNGTLWVTLPARGSAVFVRE